MPIKPDGRLDVRTGMHGADEIGDVLDAIPAFARDPEAQRATATVVNSQVFLVRQACEAAGVECDDEPVALLPSYSPGGARITLKKRMAEENIPPVEAL